MPLFKDYGDNVVKWIHPPHVNQFEGWKWGTTRKRAWEWDKWVYTPAEPTFHKVSLNHKPGENVYKGHNCFGLVYGWVNVESIDLPYFAMSLGQKKHLSKDIIKAPMTCFIVFIGSKFLNVDNKIRDSVEELSTQLSISKTPIYFYEHNKEHAVSEVRSPTPKVLDNYYIWKRILNLKLF